MEGYSREQANALAKKIILREKLTKGERQKVIRDLVMSTIESDQKFNDQLEMNKLLIARLLALEKASPSKDAPKKHGCGKPNCPCHLFGESDRTFPSFSFERIDAEVMKKMLHKAKEAMNEINKEEDGKEKEEEKEGEKNE